MDLFALNLQPGSAVWVTSPTDGAEWRIDCVEGGFWLSSPAFNLAGVDESQRQGLWLACLHEHLTGRLPAGARLSLTEADALVLQQWLDPELFADQWPLAQGEFKQLSAALEARWEEPPMAESTQEEIAQDAPPDPQAFQMLEQVVERDAALASLAHWLPELGGVILQPDSEAWVVSVLPGARAHALDILMPLGALTGEGRDAHEVLQRALRLNAGPSLGPSLLLATDADGQMLMLKAELDAVQAGSEDLQATIGQMLWASEDLSALLFDGAAADLDGSVAGHSPGGIAPAFQSFMLGLRG